MVHKRDQKEFYNNKNQGPLTYCFEKSILPAQKNMVIG